MDAKIEKKREKRYKKYEQSQIVQVPILLAEYVKDNLLVQIVNKVVDNIDQWKLDELYSTIGASSYHPKMMIKLWIYGYCNRVFTSRVLSSKLHCDLGFMWLSGCQKPCFKTLSEFRGARMQGMIDIVFQEMLVYLVIEGYIRLEDLYCDGSKWIANANQYKITWKKNTERYKAAVEERIKVLLEEIKAQQLVEDALYKDSNLVSNVGGKAVEIALNSEKLEIFIRGLEKKTTEESDKEKQKKQSSLKKQLEKEKEKLEKYENQEEQYEGRNSYSQTDVDATALRMKDERLLPGYNVQITTENQFIVHASIHPNGSDSPTMIEHIEGMKKTVSEGLDIAEWRPNFTADAGYGSEENYAYLEDNGFNTFVKYPLWYQELKGELAKKKFRWENWAYNEEVDNYVCPNDKKILYRENKIVNTSNGYKRDLRIYESEGCAGCPLYKECRGEQTKEGTNRTINKSIKLENHKAEMREKLSSEEGKEKRSKRPTEVETPFADIKHNMGHRRFVLRGKVKVRIEFYFLAISHNIRKVYCEKSGIWQDYYVQRAAKREQKAQKRG